MDLLSIMDLMSIKKYAAEFIGTFVLAFTVSLSLSGQFPVPTGFLAALALGIGVYIVGAISGAHLNPSVTIGLASIGKIGLKDAGLYLVSQFLGGGLALLLTHLTTSPAALQVANSGVVFQGEVFGTAVLALGVAAVFCGKAPAAASGLTIGGALLVGISIAASFSNAVLNPAVALAIGSFNLTYLFAPIVGSIIAMQIYRWVQS